MPLLALNQRRAKVDGERGSGTLIQGIAGSELAGTAAGSGAYLSPLPLEFFFLSLFHQIARRSHVRSDEL